MTTTLVIRHRIGDFDTWLDVYRGFADIQREGGVRAHMALRSADDPADILVTHTFATREEAETYLQDARLAPAMAEATVDEGSVRIEFFEQVSSGP
jgi:hypothetical protein